MACELRPIGDSFAQEVLGIQCWEPQPPDTVQALRAALSEHGVLVVRRQALSEREIADFSALFGPLERVVRTEWASAVVPEVGILSHLRDGNGHPIGGLGDGELHWHSDQSYMLHPATGAGLYAAEIAQQGGTTSWTNLQLAYEALPARLQRAVEGREAIFDYTKRLLGYQGKDQVISAATKQHTPPVRHPLVHVHPVTQRKALYLDATTMVGVVGMVPTDAEALLAALVAHAGQPQFVYRHTWQVGDQLIWDNGFTQHRREAFPATERRIMKRTTMFLAPERHIVPTGCLASA